MNAPRAPARLAPVGWTTSPGLTPYPAAVAVMEARAAAIAAGCGDEVVWLIEHPPLYTAGLSARAEDLLEAARLPVHRTERGGQLTYHGPGQRVVYAMLDLRRRGRDIHAYVRALEAWLIAALERLGVEAGVREGRVGVWVERDGRDAKIAAIGVRVKKWATLHGVSLNVDPDLEHFRGIVPCGIREHGVTSLAALGRRCTMAEADEALRWAWARVMGPVADAPCPLTDAAVDANGDLI